MGKFGIWQVGQGVPQKIQESNVLLEKDLEGWIEAEPSLLPGELEIICRQMIVEGGRLDLLALDPLGRYVVIEIKAGPLYSDVISQALYYAAQIDKFTFEGLESKVHEYLARKGKDLKTMLKVRGLEEMDFKKKKEILSFVVGTQSAAGIHTMLEYMDREYHVPLTAITFEVYKLEDGQRILVREITEADTPKPPEKPQKNAPSIENVCKIADQKGTGQEFRLILEEASRLGFYPRPYVRSIMYTHPDHKARMLFTVWAHKKPLMAYIGYEAFVDYYPVSTEQVADALGPAGYRDLDLEQARQLVAGLDKVISHVDGGE